MISTTHNKYKKQKAIEKDQILQMNVFEFMY